jgi:hypothetical protein
MANFGVNLEDVWQQASLVAPPSSSSKKSKYTVPVDGIQREGFANGGAGAQPYASPSHQHQPSFDLPISHSPPINSQPVYHPQHALPVQQQQQPQSSEIPKLKEQLTQQIDAVTDCQKEMHYMKALIQTLKKELNDANVRNQQQQKIDKKKKMANILWMVFIGLFLIIIVVLLVQVLQKLNQLMSQPVLFGQ